MIALVSSGAGFGLPDRFQHVRDQLHRNVVFLLIRHGVPLVLAHVLNVRFLDSCKDEIEIAHCVPPNVGRGWWVSVVFRCLMVSLYTC